jgi:hypothetical protein
MSRSRGLRHHHLLHVMMLLALLISTKMIFGENLSFARVADGGIEGCAVGTRVADAIGRQCTQLIHLEVSPPLRPPPCGDWFWCLVTIE